MPNKNHQLLPRIFISIAVPLIFAWAQDIIPPSDQSQTPPDTMNNKGPGDRVPAFIVTNTLQDQGNIGYDKGLADGKRAGAVIGPGPWPRIGCYSGCMLPCLGPSAAWILAHNLRDTPLTDPAGDSLYKSGYYEGYINATRGKKANSVLTGGIMGTCFTAGMVAVYYLVVKDVIENLRNRLSEANN